MERTSPYQGLGGGAYWRSGVAEAPYPPPDLYRPKWMLSKDDRIVTAGSCFAQHVGRALRKGGFRVMDAEPAPPGLSPDEAAAQGYGLYSARYGNLYTTRQLRQLLDEAWEGAPDFDNVWQGKGGFYDALRPGIGGFASAGEVLAARALHLEKVRAVFSNVDVFIFTLGMTEAWVHKPTGQVYATAPGTIAGIHDPALHGFVNFRLAEVRADLLAALARLKRLNPNLRVLLTVSPVPLTATASGGHVLAATTYSKAVLRACAGEVQQDHAEVDYFPSYEIVTSVRGGAPMFEANLRSVTAAAVEQVMATFTAAQGQQPAVSPAPAGPDRRERRQARQQRRRAALEGLA